jgi:predicted AlkP superfamily phosphohydrolase/phosphomutase
LTRVAVLYLDAAELAHVEELMSAGQMPNLSALVTAGARCRLRTPVEYRSEYSCTEFLTGRSARRNGYWSTVSFDSVAYDSPTVGSAVATPFYALGADTPVITFDLPHSVISDDVAGLQVVGWGNHDAPFQYTRSSEPKNLMAAIDSACGRYPAEDVEFKGSWQQEWYIDELADAIIDSARRRVDVVMWLVKQMPEWQLLLVGFSELHSVGHVMAHGLDGRHLLGSHPSAARAGARLVDVYRQIDEGIGRLREALPAETVLMVCSTKGMQANRDDVASGMLLSELLYRLGTGRRLVDDVSLQEWAAAGCPPVFPDPTRSIEVDDGRWRPPRAAALRRQLRRMPLLRRAWHAVRSTPTRAVAPAAAVAEDRHSIAGRVDWHPATWYRPWWPSMPYFALPSFSDGHVRLNVRGRERTGVVEPAEYARTCDTIERELRRGADARTGEPLVDEVIRMRDDPSDEGPGADLVVTWRMPSDAIRHPTAGFVGPFPFPRSGSHTPDGFAVWAGSGVRPGDLGTHRALDLPSTILGLLGRRPLVPLEGRSLV